MARCRQLAQTMETDEGPIAAAMTGCVRFAVRLVQARDSGEADVPQAWPFAGIGRKRVCTVSSGKPVWPLDRRCVLQVVRVVRGGGGGVGLEDASSHAHTDTHTGPPVPRRLSAPFWSPFQRRERNACFSHHRRDFSPPRTPLVRWL